MSDTEEEEGRDSGVDLGKSWIMYVTYEGEEYFHNTITSQTVWDYPENCLPRTIPVTERKTPLIYPTSPPVLPPKDPSVRKLIPTTPSPLPNKKNPRPINPLLLNMKTNNSAQPKSPPKTPTFAPTTTKNASHIPALSPTNSPSTFRSSTSNAGKEVLLGSHIKTSTHVAPPLRQSPRINTTTTTAPRKSSTASTASTSSSSPSLSISQSISHRSSPPSMKSPAGNILSQEIVLDGPSKTKRRGSIPIAPPVVKPVSRRPSKEPSQADQGEMRDSFFQRKAYSTNVSDSGEYDEDIPDDAVVDRMYVKVLEMLMMPSAVVAKLIESEGTQKKWKMITMHSKQIADVNIMQLVNWNSGDDALLGLFNTVNTTFKVPSQDMMKSMKVALRQPTRPWFESFVAKGGVRVLTDAIQLRLVRHPMSQLDSVVTLELLECFKYLMADSLGMQTVLASPGAISSIAMCLDFKWERVSLAVMEILSVTCFSSDAGHNLVLESLDRLWRRRMEKPFTSVVSAIKVKGMTVKVACMTLINTLINHAGEMEVRIKLRNFLAGLGVLEVVEEVVAGGPKERIKEDFDDDDDDDDDDASIIHSERMNDPFATGNKLNPDIGVMAGPCLYCPLQSSVGSSSSRNSTDSFRGSSNSITSMLKSFGGGKSTAKEFMKATDEYWFGVTEESLNWYKLKNGVYASNKAEGTLDFTDVVDVRCETMNGDLRAFDKSCWGLDIVCINRVISLGCKTEESRAKWFTALMVCWDGVRVRKGDWHDAAKRNRVNTLVDHGEYNLLESKLQKQIEVFEAIASSDKEQTVMSGMLQIDPANYIEFSDYVLTNLQNDGCTDKLLDLMHQLILMPTSGAAGEEAWGLLILTVKEIRGLKRNENLMEDIGDSEDGMSRARSRRRSDWKIDYRKIEGLIKAQQDMNASTGRLKELGKSLIMKDEELKKFRDKDMLDDPKFIEFKRGADGRIEALIDESAEAAMIAERLAIEHDALVHEKESLLERVKAAEVHATEAKNRELAAIKNAEKRAPTSTSGSAAASKSSSTNPKSTPRSLSSSNSTIDSASAPSGVKLKNDPRYSKYFTMVRMGLPVGAAVAKAGQDGQDVSVITVILARDPEELVSSASASNKGGVSTRNLAASIAASNAAADAVVPAVPDIKLQDDPKYSKYFKMRRMGLPMGAAVSKACQDGIDYAEITAVLLRDPEENVSAGFSSTDVNPSTMPTDNSVPRKIAADDDFGLLPKIKVVPGKKMKSLFWSKVSPKACVGTIFMDMHESSKLDFKDLENNFFDPAKVVSLERDASAGDSRFGAAAKSTASWKERPKEILLVDPKRNQNVSIALARFKYSNEEFKRKLIKFDSDLINVETINKVMIVIPEDDEVSMMEEFDGDKDLLGKVEKFYLEVIKIPRLRKRLECATIYLQFDENLKDLQHRLSLFENVTTEVQSSQSFKSVLEIVMAIGNHMNGSTGRGQAYGFKLDVLSKLINVKAVDRKKGSLMNYIVKEASRQRKKLLDFPKEMPSAEEAAGLSLRQLDSDFAALKKGLSKVRNELIKLKENDKHDGHAEDDAVSNFKTKMEPFLLIADRSCAYFEVAKKATFVKVVGNMVGFGEQEESDKELDFEKAQSLYANVANFIVNFRKALEENEAFALNEEKEAKRAKEREAKEREAKEREAKKKANGRADAVDERETVDESKNITQLPSEKDLFAAFKKAQAGRTDDIVKEFQMRLAKRTAAAGGEASE